MIYLLSELAKFLFEYIPLVTNVLLCTLIFLLLAKSVKKHPRVYYGLFFIPLVMSVVQFVLELAGNESIHIYEIPVVGVVMETNSRMANFGFPLLVVIMYIGALDARNPYVRRLLTVRKEMSIIAGSPVIAHALVRVTYTFPKALQYFTDHATYMEENDWAKSDLGVGLSNFGYVLGIIMLVVFLILWVTSFDGVHRKLGAQRWKRVQRWAYVLYAMLFVHSITLHSGWLVNGGFDDCDVTTKGIVSLASTCLIFASYLVLRLRKAQIPST